MSSLEVGPCAPWITGSDVLACCSADIGTDDPDVVFADAITWASGMLFELSGRQFAGECSQTVRPCADGCGCWDYLISPAQWPAVPWAWGWWGYGWGWGYEGCSQGDVCGCGSLSRAILQGYPVREITEVVIGDEVVDPATYRLDENRWLTRVGTDDAGNTLFWPSCQNLGTDVGNPGTWYATYTFGQDPPPLGEAAAAQLACQFYLACQANSDTNGCALPQGMTRLIRQGVTIERAPFLSWGLVSGQWATGLSLVDAFLAAYNPAGLRRRPSVWSPDLPGYGMVIPNPGS